MVPTPTIDLLNLVTHNQFSVLHQALTARTSPYVEFESAMKQAGTPPQVADVCGGTARGLPPSFEFSYWSPRIQQKELL